MKTFSGFLLAVAIMYAGSFHGCKRNASAKNFTGSVNNRVNGDSVVFVSRVRPVSNAVCNASDSVSVITVYRNVNGSISYRYSFRPASAGDGFKTYSADIPIVKTGDNLARLDIPPVGTFFAIPFRNPRTSIKIGGGIVFTCECCNGDGNCRVMGSCCPFSIGCDAAGCNGNCGLDARGSISAAVAASLTGGTNGHIGEFILIKATSVHLLN